jgi:hypothetical protein
MAALPSRKSKPSCKEPGGRFRSSRTFKIDLETPDRQFRRSNESAKASRISCPAGIEHNEVLAVALDHQTFKTIRTPGTHRTRYHGSPEEPKDVSLQV